MSNDPDPEFIRHIEQALLALPRLQREIFLACRIDNMSYEEIAQRTRLTRAQVERHFARSLSKLLKQINGRPPSWWERRF